MNLQKKYFVVIGVLIVLGLLAIGAYQTTRNNTTLKDSQSKNDNIAPVAVIDGSSGSRNVESPSVGNTDSDNSNGETINQIPAQELLAIEESKRKSQNAIKDANIESLEFNPESIDILLQVPVDDVENLHEGFKNSSGNAYILRKNGQLFHKLSATMPAPKTGGGVFYEGWLVNKNLGEFISTGVLVETTPGEYKLAFKSSKNYDGYNYVVITLESKFDPEPELHVLEGPLN